MKIKTIEAVNAYNVLKDLKVSKLSDETMLSVWKNTKALREIAEDYNKDIQAAINSLHDDDFKTMQTRLKVAQEREVKAGYEPTEADKKDAFEINKYFAAFNKKGEAYFKELADKEVILDVELVDSSEILKALKGSDKTLENAVQIEFMMK